MLDETNAYLMDVGATPVTKRKLKSKGCQARKIEQITRMLEGIGLDDKAEDDFEIMICQLQDKLETADRSEKVQILTVLPKYWSVRKVQAEFGASKYMVRKAKLKKESYLILNLGECYPSQNAI